MDEKTSENVPSEEVQKLLKDIVDFCQLEDRSVRERQIRVARQLKYFWDGLTNIWWSDTAHDWRVWDQEAYAQSYQDAAYYDKRVNVFRAYLESIIAALSVTIPPVKCAPDNAEDPLDISTAKAGDKIAKLLYKHNDVALLWTHALFIYCTEGLIFGYNYIREDEKYGTYEENQYGLETEEGYVCQACQMPLEDSDLEKQVMDQFDPGMQDVGMQDYMQEPQVLCPYCMELLDPSMQKQHFIIEKLVGSKTKPKSRVCLEAFGLLNVKVPVYAVKAENCLYLFYSYECNYVEARARYANIRSKTFNPRTIDPGGGGLFDPYEQWGRLSTQYLGEYPTNTVTVRNCWLRPSSFYYLKDQKDTDKLTEMYPNGVKVVFVNDEFAEAFNEDLDDHWTISRNPLSDHLHFQPLGLLLTSVQDITNELISLVLQTIEHGIPQTFADPGVLDFDEYRQVEVAPGQIFPASPKSGQTLGNAFYEIKTATLSGEVLPFGQEVQQLGQMASGALPSLFGGAQPNSSKTAAQYSMSKNQAMQRLQTPWKMITVWWKEIFGKAIPAYIQEVVEDEQFTEKDQSGSFINVFIRKAELEGKIGEIELESAENLPISWMQKKDIIMQFLQAANPLVLQALTSPENLPLLAEAVGLDDLELPGENDRQAQLEEIVQLVNSAPLDEMMGIPSVPIEPDVDNHEVHILIAKNWLTSEAGRFAKVDNPAGYANVLMHMKMHVQYQQMMMMQEMQMQAMMNESGGGGEKSGGPSDSKGKSAKGAQTPGEPANDKIMAPAKGAENAFA